MDGTRVRPRSDSLTTGSRPGLHPPGAAPGTFVEAGAEAAEKKLVKDEKGSGPGVLLHVFLRVPPEVLVSRGVEELVAGPGHALGPPLSGDDLVRFDESRVVKKADVVVDGRETVAVFDERAEARRAGLALLQMQEDPANQLQIALHCFFLHRAQSDVGVPSAR